MAKFKGKNTFSKDFIDYNGIKMPGTITKSIKKLINLEVVYKHQDRLKFNSPFLAYWLLEE